MTRNTAREIATHLAYELSFTDLPVQEFLDRQLSRENFAAGRRSAACMPIPPTTSRRNTSAAWCPAWPSTRRSWMPTSSSTPRAGALSASPWWPPPSCGWPCSRSSICPISPTGWPSAEAVNIAKGYESPEVVKFINGILGSFLRAEVKVTHTRQGAAALPCF